MHEMKPFNYDAPRFKDFTKVDEDDEIDRWFELKKDDPGGDYNGKRTPKTMDSFKNQRLINKAMNSNLNEFKENANNKQKFVTKLIPMKKDIKQNAAVTSSLATAKIQNILPKAKNFQLKQPLISGQTVNKKVEPKLTNPKPMNQQNPQISTTAVKYNRTALLRISTLPVQNPVEAAPKVGNPDFKLFHSTPYPQKNILPQPPNKSTQKVIKPQNNIPKKYPVQKLPPKTVATKPLPPVNSHKDLKMPTQRMPLWNNTNKVKPIPVKPLAQPITVNKKVEPRVPNRVGRPPTSVVGNRRITVPIPFSFDKRPKRTHVINVLTENKLRV